MDNPSVACIIRTDESIQLVFYTSCGNMEWTTELSNEPIIPVQSITSTCKNYSYTKSAVEKLNGSLIIIFLCPVWHCYTHNYIDLRKGTFNQKVIGNLSRTT